jgi:hypothetical protein
MAFYTAAWWDGFPPASADSKSLYRAQAAAAKAAFCLDLGNLWGCWLRVLRRQWQ